MAADEADHRNEPEFCAGAGIDPEDAISDAIRK